MTTGIAKKYDDVAKQVYDQDIKNGNRDAAERAYHVIMHGKTDGEPLKKLYQQVADPLAELNSAKPQHRASSAQANQTERTKQDTDKSITAKIDTDIHHDHADIKPKVTPKQPISMHVPSYQELGLTPTDVMGKALARPDKYIYQTWPEQQPEAFANRIIDYISTRIVGFTPQLGQQALKDIMTLEHHGYWWEDIRRGFFGCCDYDDSLTADQRLIQAIVDVRSRGKMSVVAYTFKDK